MSGAVDCDEIPAVRIGLLKVFGAPRMAMHTHAWYSAKSNPNILMSPVTRGPSEALPMLKVIRAERDATS